VRDRRIRDVGEAVTSQIPRSGPGRGDRATSPEDSKRGGRFDSAGVGQ